jgi:glucosyltransferase GtrII-like protein
MNAPIPPAATPAETRLATPANASEAVLDRVHALLTGRPRDHRAAESGAILGGLLIALAAFGFELTNPTLGIDDFGHLDMPFLWDSFWVGRGSWGGLLVQYLIPGGWITPFITLAIGIALQVATAVVLVWTMGAGSLPPWAKALLYGLFAAFPYFACQMAFSYVQTSYPLASLLMVCSVTLALAGDARRALGAILACGFAVSIYQGSLSVLGPAALFAPLAHRGVGAPSVLRRYARMLIVIAVGAALFLVVHKLLLAILEVTGRNAYYSVGFDWKFWERWGWIRSEIAFLFFGAGDVIPVKAVVVFLLAAAMLLFADVGRPQRLGARLISGGRFALLAVLAMLSPFVVLFVHEGQLAPRSSVGVAVVWLVVFAVLLGSASRLVRRAATAAIGVVIVMFAFHDNRMFFAQSLVTQADMAMMARIAERIDQLPLEHGSAPTPVVIVGAYSRPPYEGMPRFYGDVLGYSQFEWNPADTRWAVRGLARAIGVDHYVWHDPAELGGVFAEPALVEGRQPWPHRSAVFARDGYAVVWLGKRREDRRISPLQAWFDAIGKPSGAR